MTRFVQIASTYSPQVDGLRAGEHILHALDEDGVVWRHVVGEVERDEKENPIYEDEERTRIRYVPPYWETLSLPDEAAIPYISKREHERPLHNAKEQTKHADLCLAEERRRSQSLDNEVNRLLEQVKSLTSTLSSYRDDTIVYRRELGISATGEAISAALARVLTKLRNYESGEAERACRRVLDAKDDETTVAACARLVNEMNRTKDDCGSVRESTIKYMETEMRKDLEAKEGETAHVAAKRLLRFFKVTTGFRSGFPKYRFAPYNTVAHIKGVGARAAEVPVCEFDSATVIGENLLAALERAKQ